MSERFFRYFKFKPIQQRRLEIIAKDKNAIYQASVNELRELGFPFDGVDFFESEPTYLKTALDVVPDFEITLGEINNKLDCRLSMCQRELVFVEPNDLKPKTEREKRKLIEKYGKYMKDGGSGDCTFLDDGFILRVGFVGETTKHSLLDLMAHEYGHTLGTFLDSVVFEELKAFAFASLFQRFYDKRDQTTYHDLREKFDRRKPHDAAKSKLAQLLNSGIPEEAILAHLTGKNFGEFGPQDYIKFIQRN